MSPDKRTPPRLISDVRPDPEVRTVTFRTVDKQVVSTRIGAEEAVELADEVRATWQHAQYNSITLNDVPGGVTVLLNPAHIVTMEIR